MNKTKLLNLINSQATKSFKNIVIVTEESDYYVLGGSIIKSKNGYMTLKEYNEDLTCDEYPKLDIKEIWYGHFLGYNEFDPFFKEKCIWKRVGEKTRQEYNMEILKLFQTKFPENDEIYDDIEYLINQYPDQRFGQIFCNYICPDYRHDRKSVYTNILINKWFGNDILDPFFEESKETLVRLQNV